MYARIDSSQYSVTAIFVFYQTSLSLLIYKLKFLLSAKALKHENASNCYIAKILSFWTNFFVVKGSDNKHSQSGCKMFGYYILF